MAETGLASAIITFVTLAASIGKRTHQFIQLAGELPADLQSCKDIVEVLARSSQRLHNRLPKSLSNGAIQFGPPTAYEIDLKLLYEQCSETTESLLRLFNDICAPRSSLLKALRSVRSEGKLQRIRNDLQQRTLAILSVLEENSHITTNEIQ
ncbi:hypothetical protein EJ08DRAFT_648405 [Tothia fuscella]|uniref:Uncharacterized protein n=1 Tax=Tothia fuscella TaxID=1048955 RepID=A0A9P4U0L0_9PEZI|nr:hypothetical protein EJ08DRAFT_648405 [Tothia fuscella]